MLAYKHAGLFDAKNNVIGTIASKSKNLINNELSEFDLGLLNTKSGIIYRDENLNADNEVIIKNRDIEVRKSNKISASEYKKNNFAM